VKRVYLLTGQPGTGKTSLIKQEIAGREDKAVGFYTEEIRSGGTRQGFRLVTLDGQSIILAHTGIDSPHRVGKYGVDIEALERVGVAALEQANRKRELVVIDEIGKMELLSAVFQKAVWHIIKNGKKVLGSIMLSHHPWADSIKSQPQVRLITVTRTNHSQVLDELETWLNA